MIQKLLNRETVTYLICGVLTTAVGFGVFWLCTEIGLYIAAANTVSTVLAVLFAYAVNKIWVFRSGSWAIVTVLREAASFFTGRLAMYIMETGLLIFMVDFMQWPSLWCKGFTMVLVVIGNYLISKRFVFKKND